jgi:hypothetical protein
MILRIIILIIFKNNSSILYKIMTDSTWERAVNLMITSINSDNNMLDFFKNFNPDENSGYAWSQNSQYKYYTNILDRLTDETGHSGASFACCLRESVNRIREEIVVIDKTSVSEENIITLEPIS